jgi:type II restriction enzyme
MNLSLNNFATFDYKSNSQKIRVMSESWFLKNGYCVNCFNILHDFENNKPVADFYCEKCSEEFELKSKEGKFGKKINDGAYKTMIERINSNNNPNLIILSYQKDFSVNDIIAIPKYFFTESIIEKRKALSDTAKRSGWVGCNILISEIPEIGKIFLVKNSEVINKKIVASNWKLSEKFKIKDVKSRG